MFFEELKAAAAMSEAERNALFDRRLYEEEFSEPISLELPKVRRRRQSLPDLRNPWSRTDLIANLILSPLPDITSQIEPAGQEKKKHCRPAEGGRLVGPVMMLFFWHVFHA